MNMEDDASKSNRQDEGREGDGLATPLDGTPDYTVLSKRPLGKTIGFYLVLTGFCFLGLAAWCFFLSRSGRVLQYRDFVVNSNVLGTRLLIAGAVSYGVGRVLAVMSGRRRNDRNHGT